MKNYKKLTLALLIGISCMNLYGCNDNQTTLYNPDDSSEISTESTFLSDETTLLSETENITPLKQAIQDISVMYTQNGQTAPELALLCLTEETDASGMLTEIEKNQLPVNNGALKVGLNLLVYSPEEVECKVKGTFVMFWNGQPYDFSIGDNQSADGTLQLDLLYNEETVLPLEAINLPIQEGENTLYFCFIPYCEEKGIYLTPQRYYAYYNSNQILDGCSPVAITAENELPQELIDIVVDKTFASNTYYSIDTEDIIHSKYDNYNIHSNPTFHLNISNVINLENSSNRSGIGMLIADGELQPVWNNKKYLSVSLSSEEVIKTISAKTSYQNGEKHDICMLYAELKDDQNLDGEPFLYSEMSYCTIEE